MTTFALITEGITDQIVIETILHSHYSGVLNEGEEVEVRALQPLRDATDEARQDENTFGGWERVLEHCTLSDNISEAAAFNDFIIIQIDTDCAEHKNFGVPLTANGTEKAVNELIEDVKNLIISKIGHQVYSTHEDKFIFAVAIHSTECWLLPLYAKTKAHATRTKSCENHLKHLIKVSGEDFRKDYDCYRKIAMPLRKKKMLVDVREKNESLNIFIASLPELADAAE